MPQLLGKPPWRPLVSNLFLVDCEAPYGITSPIIAPCTEVGIVLFDCPPFSTSYHWTRPPHFYSHNYAPGARSMAGRESIQQMADWIRLHSSSSHAIMVSDNPAYDFQWIAALFADAGIPNPFGHSARRIGDFAAGLSRNFRSASAWKKLRKTPHDHNPVNDARGNAEALWSLLQQAGS